MNALAPMTNDVNTFTFPGSTAAEEDKTIRMVMIEGEPWFVAADVCDALGLIHTANAVRPLGNDEKRIVTKATNSNLFTFGRGSARLRLISESGLYKLIMRSDKPEARGFQD